MNKTYRIAVGAGSLAAGVGLLAGCSVASAPQAMDNLSVSHSAVRVATLGDDPDGCYQRGTLQRTVTPGGTVTTPAPQRRSPCPRASPG